MLKITNNATANENRWTLSGQLAGPWVAELRSNWDQVRDRSHGRGYVIVLSGVTVIEKGGGGLLAELGEGVAEFGAGGVYFQPLLENLKRKKGRPRQW